LKDVDEVRELAREHCQHESGKSVLRLPSHQRLEEEGVKHLSQS
jgi:hypothetical protein